MLTFQQWVCAGRGGGGQALAKALNLQRQGQVRH